MTLAGILWRYLFGLGGSIGFFTLLWWIIIIMLMNTGLILPANTAAASLQEVERRLNVREVPEEELHLFEESIPYFYHWALLDVDGGLLESDMTAAGQAEAVSVGPCGGVGGGFPYTRYYQGLRLSDGRSILLQYDYSVPYGNAKLQERLPDFQICAIAFLICVWLLMIFLWTGYYSGILKRDAGKLMEAVKAIEERRLDTAFPDGVRVRELAAVMDSMSRLRSTLADSFSRQWLLEQAQREELSALSHDLKTPLTIIQGNADLLAEELPEGEQRQQIEAIVDSAEHLREYTDRLRAVSTGNGQGCREGMEPVLLRELMTEASRSGRALCKAAGITFVEGEIPDFCFPGKRNLLLRAVLNLLDNAARYTPGGGTVELQALRENGMLVIAVRDSGPGFSEEALRKGGNIFYTSDSSRPREGHMGIGLKFVSETAKAHGGAMSLYNTERGGNAEILLKAEPDEGG